MKLLKPLLFAAVLLVSIALFVSLSASKRNQTLANKILADPLLDKVEQMALENIASGFNAGSGYKAVWIRDFNTLEDLAMEVFPQKKIENVLVTFMLMQDASGSILDGYVEKGFNDQVNEFTFDAVKNYTGHKNTVETDQESSLILAICKYVNKYNCPEFLKSDVGGISVAGHIEAAMNFLLTERFDKAHGLIWGATTADWGDVQPENEVGVILDSNSHLCLDIYDNALFISALNEYIGIMDDPEGKKHWSEVRDGLVANAGKYLWDSKRQKYHPHVYLDGSPFPATFDEEAIYYHGGTGVAMEAGLLSKKQIWRAYQTMKANKESAGANSIGLSLYPAYPTGFFKHPILTEAYTYQNGGDWTWFGARIITQLVKAGYVEEAYEELRPMLERAAKADDFHEWYSLEGEPRGSACYRGAAGVLYVAIKALRDWALTAHHPNYPS